MNEQTRAALRIVVLAVTGYLCLATSAPEDWFLRSAHVDLAPPTARIKVTLDAEAVIIMGPGLLAIQSSSGRSWTSGDLPTESDGYCSAYHREATFCEEVPNGSATLEYDLFVQPLAPSATTTRVEVIAGGIGERLQAKFGVNIEVLP